MSHVASFPIRSFERALAALAFVALSSSCIASAQHVGHALPVAALADGALTVQSIRAPDAPALPVQVVLASEQGSRFLVDVWTTSSIADADALLAARVSTSSTHGLVARTDLAHAYGTAATGRSSLLALRASNVVLVVQASGDGDAVGLARRLADAVLASAPTPVASLMPLASLDESLVVQQPTSAVEWVVTCDGACEARRARGTFAVTRTGEGDVTLAMHVVDAFLRVQHVVAH